MELNKFAELSIGLAYKAFNKGDRKEAKRVLYLLKEELERTIKSIDEGSELSKPGTIQDKI